MIVLIQEHLTFAQSLRRAEPFTKHATTRVVPQFLMVSELLTSRSVRFLRPDRIGENDNPVALLPPAKMSRHGVEEGEHHQRPSAASEPAEARQPALHTLPMCRNLSHEVICDNATTWHLVSTNL